MRTLCCLLLASCLLLCHPGPGMGDLFQKSDQYICVKNGGICRYYTCPPQTKALGSCYNSKAMCCKRDPYLDRPIWTKRG